MDRNTREFAGISAAGLLLYFSYSVSRSPIIPLFARSLGASPLLVGWIVAASTITGIFVKLPAGTLSDRFGRRALLIAGACFFAITPFLYAGVATVGALIFVRVLHGNATAIFSPTSSAAISDITDPGRRGVRMGLYASVQGVGQALGPTLGGALISLSGFHLPFLVSGVIGTVGLACVLLTVRQVSENRAERRRTRVLEGIKEVFRSRPILATSSTVASMMVVVGSYNGFFPLYAAEVLRFDPWQIGTIFTIQTTTTLLARPLMGRFSDSVGRKPLIVGALFWSSLLIASLPHLQTPLHLFVFAGAWGLGVSVVSSVAGALITDIARSSHYGAAHGTFGSIYDTGEALGPILAGIMVTHLGYGVMFLSLGVFLALCTTGFAATTFKPIASFTAN